MFSVNFVYNLDNFKSPHYLLSILNVQGIVAIWKEIVLLILYSHRSLVIPRLLWCYITYSHDDWCKRWQYVVIWVDVIFWYTSFLVGFCNKPLPSVQFMYIVIYNSTTIGNGYLQSIFPDAYSIDKSTPLFTRTWNI